MNAIEINNLTKIFQPKKQSKVIALDELSLSIESGIIYGLLGPNGAGKTTLIKILLGIAFPTVGDAKLLGENIGNYKIREKVGYLPENHKFPSFLTGEGVMKYFARLSGNMNKNINSEIDKLLSLVKMDKWKKTKVKKYSKGMMQRLGLAQSLINDPEIIFLDEPTDGVDPIGRKEIRDLLIELKNKGKTIFINSHLLSEVELVSDRIAILNKGKLIKEGTVEEITTSKQSYLFDVEPDLPEELLTGDLMQFKFNKNNNGLYSAVIIDIPQLNKAIDLLRKNNINIKEIRTQKSSLEDKFISLIKEVENKN